MGRMYYHRNKIKDTLQGSVRLFEYHGHPPTKYHQIPSRLSARRFNDVIGFRSSASFLCSNELAHIKYSSSSHTLLPCRSGKDER